MFLDTRYEGFLVVQLDVRREMQKNMTFIAIEYVEPVMISVH